MSGRSIAFLAATGAFVLFGGLHLEMATGRGLDRLVPNDASLRTGTTNIAINRGAKTDREAIFLSTAEGSTITFQHPDLPSTTIAVRLWEMAGAAKGRPVPKELKDKKAPAGKPKQAVACEGVVSALTEVAKQLEAGRCVT
jgi:hypothetical protein